MPKFVQHNTIAVMMMKGIAVMMKGLFFKFFWWSSTNNGETGGSFLTSHGTSF
jgi:hypothetical protein